MNNLEAIKKRKSRRTYLGTTIDESKISIIKTLINNYNLEGDLSIEFVEDGSQAFNSLSKSYGMFKGVRSLIALKGKKADPNLKEKLGRYGELLVLEATKIGLGTCWVGGTFDHSSDLVKVMENEELHCLITIGNIADEKSLKEKFIHKLSHVKSKSREDLYSSDSPILPQWFLQGMEAVLKAPSAKNSQKIKFEFKGGQVTASIEDSYVFDLIDLGIAKTHFSIATGGTFELGNPGKFKES